MTIKLPPNSPIEAVFDILTQLDFIQYSELVMTYLEELNYPDLAIEFDAEPLSHCMNQTMRVSHSVSLSFRMCALIIYGQTYSAIVRLHNESNDTKH